MISGPWSRKVALLLVLVAALGLLAWLVTRVDPDYRPMAQTVAAIVLLVGCYASGPAAARFLAQGQSTDAALQHRVASIRSSVQVPGDVQVYSHASPNAFAVGLFSRHARIYLTSSLAQRLSDKALAGILAHELVHMRERHIMVNAAYACCYVLVAQAADSLAVLVLGLLGLLALRRHLEYRADAGAAALVGKQVVATALQELQAIEPQKRWNRWLVFAAIHPTLSMRMAAIESGNRPMI